MRISISNIAWDTVLDEAVAALLRRYAVDAIDIAPGKYFPDPAAAKPADFERVRGWWNERGIDIIGMQALLFGTKGLNLFGVPESRAAMLAHLGAVCRVGAGVGATRMVFGSPKNRDRGSLDFEAAADQAAGFFRELGAVAADHGVTVCLEPNPVHYGCNFMTNSDEAARVVERAAHPFVRLQLDTGAMASNAEPMETTVQRVAELVGHVHASEPGLVPLGDGGADHAAAGRAVARHLPQQVVCIEMLSPAVEPALVSIERALQVALRHYGSDAPGNAP